MLPSLHDNYLVSYTVNCEARRIELCALRRGEECKTLTIAFNGVEGYHFENDGLAT
jgi:hypothetical protein